MAINNADFCNTVQQTLDEIAGTNPGAFSRESTGFLDSLVSPQNRAGIGQNIDIDPGNGKFRQVQVEIIQAGLTSAADDASTNICTQDGTSVANSYDLVTIGQFARSEKLEFSETDLRKFCESVPERIARVISTRWNPLMNLMNEKLLALSLTKYGTFYDGVAGPKDIELIQMEGGRKTATYNGELEMSEDFADLGYNGMPIVVGRGLVSDYAKLRDIGCCNHWGQEVDNMGDFHYFRDRMIDAVYEPLAGNTMLTYVPGAFQLLKANQNVGDFMFKAPDFEKGTVRDPLTGLVFDIVKYFDKCLNSWNIVISLNYDLWAMPKTVFQDTDPRDGSNGILLYNAITTV